MTFAMTKSRILRSAQHDVSGEFRAKCWSILATTFLLYQVCPSTRGRLYCILVSSCKDVIMLELKHRATHAPSRSPPFRTRNSVFSTMSSIFVLPFSSTCKRSVFERIEALVVALASPKNKIHTILDGEIIVKRGGRYFRIR